MAGELHDNTIPSRALGPSGSVDPIQIGELISSVNHQADSLREIIVEVKAMRGDIHQFTRKMDNFENVAEKLNSDVMEIRDDIRKRPTTEKVDTLIDERLRNVGIYPMHSDEHQKDQAYLRKARQRDENMSTMKMWAMRILVGALVTGILTWTGTAVYNQFKEEIRAETTK